MVNILITDGIIVTLDDQRRIIQDGAIAISGNRILAVGKSADFKKRYKADIIIEAKNKVIFPGLINVHTHLFQTLLKGLGDNLSLTNWFNRAIAPFAPELSSEDCYVAALLGCIEAVKSGVTCINDFMYVHPRPKLSDQVIRAFLDVGIRGILTRGIVDTGEDIGLPEAIIQDTNDALEDCKRLIQEYEGFADGKIHVWIAPGSIWYATPEAFKKAKQIADKHNVWLSTHCAESSSVVELSKRKHGMSELEFEEKVGFLGSNVQLVHCIWLTGRDVRIMKRRAVKVAHCPIANMYLADGIAPVPKLIRAGIKVGLGTDGAASNNNQDMIAVLKHTALLHKVHTLDPTAITAEKVLEMATLDGAKSIGLENEIGSIEPGKKADLILLDFKKPNTVVMHNPVSTLVYCATQENVDTVIIDGKIIMEGRKIKTVNEEDVLKASEEAGELLVQRAGMFLKFRDRPWRSSL